MEIATAARFRQVLRARNPVARHRKHAKLPAHRLAKGAGRCLARGNRKARLGLVPEECRRRLYGRVDGEAAQVTNRLAPIYVATRAYFVHRPLRHSKPGLRGSSRVPRSPLLQFVLAAGRLRVLHARILGTVEYRVARAAGHAAL